MQIIGQAVTHPVFGQGTVTKEGGGFITVRFSDCEKTFLYPSAFSGFLVLRDAGLQKDITGIIARQAQEEHLRQQAALEKWEKEIYLRNMKISPQAQAVFDVPPQELEAVFSSWHVSTGIYLSGYSKGEPRIPDRMKPNSMCIITFRPAGGAEAQRRIAGVFMTPTDFEGPQCRDGLVPAHSEYRLCLSPELQPAYWPYAAKDPSRQKWGNTRFKYLPNTAGEAILFDLVQHFKKSEMSEEASDAAEFYRYYCQLNQLHKPRL